MKQKFEYLKGVAGAENRQHLLLVAGLASAIFAFFGLFLSGSGSADDGIATTSIIVSDNGETTNFVTSAATVGEALKEAGVVLEPYESTEPKRATKLEGGELVVTVQQAHPIKITDGDFEFETFTSRPTVGEALLQHGITLKKSDLVIPALADPVDQGTNIIITRSPAVEIVDGTKRYDVYTSVTTVGELLKEQGIALDEDDELKTKRTEIITPGMSVVIVRVEKKQVEEDEQIAFETVYQDDSTLLRGTEEVAQEGSSGTKHKVFNIVLRNGEETSRELVSEEITEKPISRVIRRGTMDSIGVVMTGEASWYDAGNGLTTAARDFAVGTRLRVTNLANGKTVTVTVSGWGPQPWTGRLIDLNRSAFESIADLGTGVLSVKIEELL